MLQLVHLFNILLQLLGVFDHLRPPD